MTPATRSPASGPHHLLTSADRFLASEDPPRLHRRQPHDELGRHARQGGERDPARQAHRTHPLVEPAQDRQAQPRCQVEGAVPEQVPAGVVAYRAIALGLHRSLPDLFCRRVGGLPHRHARRPLQLLPVLVALEVALPAFLLSPPWIEGRRHALTVGLPALFHLFVETRFRIDERNNLQARCVQTRVRLLRHITVSVIVVLAARLRALMSAAASPSAWELRCQVREELLDFLQREYPEEVPRVRAEVGGEGRSEGPGPWTGGAEDG